MNRSISADEAKERAIEAMGNELGDIYDWLWHEVEWIHRKWNEYVELFGTKETRIDLLNNAAPEFFSMLQTSMFEDVILHIARLTDRKGTCGKESLTIQWLSDLIEDEKNKAEIKALTDTALAKSEFCKNWRDRHIAHRDLKIVRKEEELLPASRKKVAEALKAITVVMNAVSIHYEKSTTPYGMVSQICGAVDLLYVIADGLDYEEEKKKKRESGQYDPDDWITRDI